MESKIYNQDGKETGKMVLPEPLFGAKWVPDMVHQVVTSVLSSRRNVVAHAKTRGEVSGGGKKPWRQKGTGRARHGSTRSPIWVGGGTTHGPRNDKNYSRKVNQKTLNSALCSVLSKKAKDGEVLLLSDLKLEEVKTKNAVSVLRALSNISGFKSLSSKKQNMAFLVLPEKDTKIERAFSNISNVGVLEARNLSMVDTLSKKFLIFVDPENVFGKISSRVK